MSPTTRSAIAALALAVPVIAEIARPESFDTAGGHLVFAVSQLVGWALIASVVHGAPAAARDASPRARRVVLTGCALQMCFAAVYGVTALDAEPLEASFIPFLLGFVLLLVGGLLWASRLRRIEAGRAAAAALATMAVLGALAMLASSDPFHDVFLLSSYATWVLVGRGFTALGHADATGRVARPLGEHDRPGLAPRH